LTIDSTLRGQTVKTTAIQTVVPILLMGHQ
jgi:hypothetical protein